VGEVNNVLGDISKSPCRLLHDRSDMSSDKHTTHAYNVDIRRITDSSRKDDGHHPGHPDVGCMPIYGHRTNHLLSLSSGDERNSVADGFV